MPIKEDFFPDDKYEKIRRELIKKQLQQKEYYDRGYKELKPLADGEKVMLKLKGNGPLENSKVITKADRPRSYRIMTENGNIYERNRRHLCKGSSKVPFQVSRKSNNYYPDSPEETSSKLPTMNSTMCNKALVQGSKLADKSEGHIPLKITRTGRVIKPPSYLKDYV